jgi:hypothetical protein
MSQIIDTVLKSWASVNECIPGLREDQLMELIQWEVKNKKRPDIVERLHQRYSKLVAAREREELLILCGKGDKLI